MAYDMKAFASALLKQRAKKAGKKKSGKGKKRGADKGSLR